MMASTKTWTARRPTRMAGILICGLLIVAAWAALTLDPLSQDLMKALEPPSLAHPLGTDHLGRDVLARVVHAAPRSLGIALVCVTGAAGLGIALGLVAAYAGRLADICIMRLCDLLLALPGILLALLLAGFLGGGIIPMLIGIKVALWPQFTRMSRSVALGVLNEPHVEAARLAGFPAHTILLRHVLPPVLRQTVCLASLGTGAAVMSISALGFLGLGLKPPTPEWGSMTSELIPYLADAPVQMAAPCVAIFLTVLTVSVLGEFVLARRTRLPR